MWEHDKNNVNQQWEMIQIPVEISKRSQVFAFRKNNTGHCLDVDNRYIEDGADLYLWTCDINNENQWWFAPTDNTGATRLFKIIGSKVFAVDGNKPLRANGVNVHMWNHDINNSNQDWLMEVVE